VFGSFWQVLEGFNPDMIEQNVHVLQCSGERMWVRMGSQTGCTACDNGRGCGAGLFAKLLQRKPVVLELARNDINVEAGQMLTLAVPGQLFVKLVLTSYGWPLLAALAGAYAGYGAGSWLQWDPQMIDLATLAAGGLAGWLFLRLIRRSNTTETILKSLRVTACRLPDTPSLCNGSTKTPAHPY
jgi:positive regulator of sigma E activity